MLIIVFSEEAQCQYCDIWLSGDSVFSNTAGIRAFFLEGLVTDLELNQP